MKNQLAIIKSPKFWNEVYTGNSWTNSTKGGVKTAGNDKEKNRNDLFEMTRILDICTLRK